MRKKILLIAAVSLFALSDIYSQITATDDRGNPIGQSDEFIFNHTGENASLYLSITNAADTDANLYLKAENIEGGNGSGFVFCIGACYFGIEAGNTYPPDVPFVLAAGATSGQNDVYFYQEDDSNNYVSYSLKIYEEDNESNSISFIYTYNADYTHTEDVYSTEIAIYPTLVKHQLHIKSSYTQIKSIKIKDIRGKEISRFKTNNHTASISVSDLPDGMYFTVIKTADGEQIVRKFIKIQ